MHSCLSTPSPLPSLSPLAAWLKASLPSEALSWPCGQPTCTGQCAIFKTALKTGPPPLPPGRKRRPRHSGNIRRNGYAVLRVKGRLRYVHRIVMELVLGEPLQRDQVVHHRDGNKLHNCPPNLELLGRAHHAWQHHHTFPLVGYCEECGRPFIRQRWDGKPARFCCQRCWLKTRSRIGRHRRQK
jgi:hypothetical protein